MRINSYSYQNNYSRKIGFGCESCEKIKTNLQTQMHFTPAMVDNFMKNLEEKRAILERNNPNNKEFKHENYYRKTLEIFAAKPAE